MHSGALHRASFRFPQPVLGKSARSGMGARTGTSLCSSICPPTLAMAHHCQCPWDTYMKNSKAFILSSLWEEVGFVIVEAAICNTFVISSNCRNGPKEFLMDGKAGFLFENNEDDELFKKLKEFKKLEKKEIFEKKVLAKKNSVKFTMFKHFLSLKNIIEKN